MSDQLKIQIGQRIKAARNQRSLAQEKLSEMADCHIDSLSLIERGKTLPSVDLLVRLCDALDIDLVALLQPSRGTKAPSRNNLEAELWAMIEGFSDADLEKLKSIAAILLR